MILVAAAVTSVIAWLVGRRVLGLDAPGGAPIVLMLEYLGAIAVFLVLDAFIGVLLIFVTRAVTGLFVPLHVMTDIILGPLAACQGLVFWSWWRARKRCR